MMITKLAASIITVGGALGVLNHWLHLLRYDPRTVDERRDLRTKQILGQLGYFHWLWETFLRACRSYSTEGLSPRQKRARHVFCPVLGHKFVRIEPMLDSFLATCERCHYTGEADSLEGLREIERGGKARISPMYIRTRTRVPKALKSP